MPRKYTRRRTTRRAIRRTRKRSRRLYKPPTVMRSSQLICADRFLTNLRFLNVDTYQLPAEAISPVTFYKFNLNGLWDMDPLLGSSVISGFTEIGALYNSYRAVYADVSCTFVNNQTLGIYVGVSAFNEDQNVPVSWAAWTSLEGQPYTRQFFLGPNSGGKDTVTLKMRVNFSQLLGDRNLYQSNLNFKGETAGGLSTGSNPFSIFPLYVYAMNPTPSVAFNSTLPFRLKIKYRTEFFDRIVVST